jgi:hypothetical protein
LAGRRTEITGASDENYAVTLPVGEDQLKEFLAGLLGKPQTIARRLHGPFKVTRADIEDVHILLEQRISAQNNAALASFVARIVYDDNSSVQLNSFLEFKTYNEVKPLRSTAIHLSWTYLVQFQNKTIYEKQQVDLSISVAEPDRQVIIDAEFPNRRIARLGHRGLINLRISHSDRSWGGDIDAL